MNKKENSMNRNIYNQISKKGQIENDKKLLIKKFGFRNLSYSNLHIENNASNKNYSLNTYSLSSLQNDIKIKKNLNESSNIKLKTLQNLNNATRNPNQKNQNLIKNYQISLNLKNKSSKKKLINRNNKSMAILPINPILDINYISDYSLTKIKSIINKNESKKNNNISTINTGVAHNTTKTNQNTYSNKDILEISFKKKLIKKDKSNQKYHNKNNKNNSSSPNLLINIKKEIIKKKINHIKYLIKKIYITVLKKNLIIIIKITILLLILKMIIL